MLTNLRLNKYAKNLLRYLLSKDGMNVPCSHKQSDHVPT